jgi:hypothetical protein
VSSAGLDASSRARAGAGETRFVERSGEDEGDFVELTLAHPAIRPRARAIQLVRRSAGRDTPATRQDEKPSDEEHDPGAGDSRIDLRSGVPTAPMAVSGWGLSGRVETQDHDQGRGPEERRARGSLQCIENHRITKFAVGFRASRDREGEWVVPPVRDDPVWVETDEGHPPTAGSGGKARTDNPRVEAKVGPQVGDGGRILEGRVEEQPTYFRSG